MKTIHKTRGPYRQTRRRSEEFSGGCAALFRVIIKARDYLNQIWGSSIGHFPILML
jgi:hypothetical protein